MAVSKSSTTSTKSLLVVAAVVAVGAAGWYGWQYFAGERPPASETRIDKAGGKSSKKAANQEALIDEALHVTGLKRQLEQLPQQVRDGVAAAPGRGKIPPAVAQEIEQIVLSSFNEQNIHQRIVGRLKKDFNQQYLQALIADFSTPAVKRMVAMEVKTGTLEEQAAFFNTLSAKPLSQERINAIQQLDQATKGSELGADIALSSIKAMAVATVGDNATELAKLEKTLEKQRSAMIANLRNTILAYYAFLYREASDAELSAYARIYEGEHAKWFTDIAMGALKDGFDNASKQSGERLVALMKSRGLPQPTVAGAGGKSAAATAGPGEKPAAPAQDAVTAGTTPSKTLMDARECLALEGNQAIATCAEQYR